MVFHFSDPSRALGAFAVATGHGTICQLAIDNIVIKFYCI